MLQPDDKSIAAITFAHASHSIHLGAFDRYNSVVRGFLASV